VNAKIQEALNKTRPVDSLQALIAAIPYTQPSDFSRLSADGKLIVCCHCFAFEMFSGGYLKVLENLPDWTDEIVKSLRGIRAEPYAEGLAKVIRIAKKNRLAPFSDTDWSEYLEKHPEFELETVRDYERALDVVADRLRDCIRKNASTFAP
jgi:hypothetical protein